MARQHKAEVMIAGEQLRYEGRDSGLWHTIRLIGDLSSKVGHTADFKF